MQEKMRKVKGHRTMRRKGSMSLAEKNGRREFDSMLTATRYMDGELAEWTWRDITTLLARVRVLCERYSFENVPDITGLDRHVIANELDLVLEVPAEPN